MKTTAGMFWLFSVTDVADYFIPDFEITMAAAAVTVSEGDGTISVVIAKVGSLSADTAVICYTTGAGNGIARIFFFLTVLQ